MIMKIAIAKDGFVDTNDNPNLQSTDTFLQCLEKILNFQELDLMEFDGNSCQIINSYDPTNSIFIYTNQQGTFLYTITSATPRVHKNNMIWDCTCYKMEDMANIENVIADNKIAQTTIFKSIAPSRCFMEGTNNLKGKNILPEYTIVEKGNYQSQSTKKFSLGGRYWCYKLKFLVNPTTENLTTYEPDGSFNFFFPFYVYDYSKVGNEDFPLQEPTNYIQDETTGGTHTQLHIDDIIKKYSTNLKSVELIPFFPKDNNVLGGNIVFRNDSLVEITEITGGKFTDAGIFMPYGHSTNNSFNLFLSNYGICLKDALRLGGGVKGILKLPLGAIQLDANSFFQKGDDFKAYIKSEGWSVDGLFSAEIPAHYINFYTDETSQLYIANMTTNAQELRQINRQYEYDKKMLSERYRLGQVKEFADFGFDFARNMDLLGAGSRFSQSSLQNYIDYSFDKQERKAEYDLSREIYEDDIKTQELISKYTGKSISGNSLATDIILNLSKDNFMVILNANYQTKRKYYQSETQMRQFIIPQRDYDYSVEYSVNREETFNANQFMPRLNRTNTYLSQYEYHNISNMLKNIFGYDNENIAGYEKIQYYDEIGLNYNIVFKIENLPTETPTGSGTIAEDLKQTQILKFPIRHKQKWFF